MGTNSFKKLTKYLPLPLIFFFLSCSFPKIIKPIHTHKVHIVEILDSQFKPSVVIVDSGDVVKWINKDFTGHQVVGFYGDNLRTSVLGYGESGSQPFNKSTSYACIIHPEMLGIVRVRLNK